MFEEKFVQYLKMSVVNAIFTLKKYQNTYPDKSIDEIIKLIRASKSYIFSFDYDTASILLRNWDFSKVNDLKEYIAQVLLQEQPKWLLQVPFGREIVADSLLDNDYTDIIQCFNSAGLFDSNPDQETVEWWDKIAGFVRNNQNEENVKSGRLGEILSLNYEKERLIQFELEPKWISIENNFAGYDILSYNVNGNLRKKIMIEVKTCKTLPITFYITNNEWKVAQEFGEGFVFHIWYLPKKELHILKVKDVETSIPCNRGNGKWQNILVKLE
ncbi:DUF3883 domain-containing protein [Psychrobacillus sp. FSL H8-0483]|uniref:DUF3883 domain-containing protein n=1 Tax=Psychrobacillus sp. FSL H8-0483 TaxID=2921389 RepID=UPI00315B2ED2